VAALAAVVAFAPRTSEAVAPSTHRGLTAKQWHVRYAKEHRALTKHGRMVRTLRDQVSRARQSLRRVISAELYGTHWLERAFICIHGYEGNWNDPNAPYYGGLQMDMSFQRAYGPEFLAKFGTADKWPVSVQMSVAIKAFLSGRGFHPWPNTARYCGLLP
jgi:hypothetical protein